MLTIVGFPHTIVVKRETQCSCNRCYAKPRFCRPWQRCMPCNVVVSWPCGGYSAVAGGNGPKPNVIRCHWHLLHGVGCRWAQKELFIQIYRSSGHGVKEGACPTSPQRRQSAETHLPQTQHSITQVQPKHQKHQMAMATTTVATTRNTSIICVASEPPMIPPNMEMILFSTRARDNATIQQTNATNWVKCATYATRKISEMPQMIKHQHNVVKPTDDMARTPTTP